ncbi:MAG: GNAT family N-acetyltransferase [Proteobacteria bacterium]|nr:GNAT family N-acetyltransferase [Pseudomonadota bacterium]
MGNGRRPYFSVPRVGLGLPWCLTKNLNTRLIVIVCTVNSSRFAVGMYRKFCFVDTGPPVTKDGVTLIPMKLAEPDE